MVSAAQITLKNGDVIIGEIKQEKVPFQAKIGNIKIKAKEIESFKEGKLQLKDGTIIVGDLGGDSLNISTSWGGEISVNAKEIAEIFCEQEPVTSVKQKVKDTPHIPPKPATETYKEVAPYKPPATTQPSWGSGGDIPPPKTWAKTPTPLKKTIAVATFENRASKASVAGGGIGTVRRKGGSGALYGPVDVFDPITRGLADQMTDALVQSGRFRVLDRQIIESIIAEQDLAASGRTTKEGEGARTGKIVPAQMLVKGAVTEFDPGTAGSGQAFNLYGFNLGSSRTEAHVAVIIYLVNTTTTQVIDSQRIEGKAERGGMVWGYQGQKFGFGQAGFKETPLGKATQIVIDRAVEYISQRLAREYWQGRVAKIDGNMVFINSGSSAGIVSGQEFIACKGINIVDPSTGVSLGHSLNPVGLIRVANVYPDFSGAVLIDGSLPVRGDFVVERGVTGTSPYQRPE